ncbi:MAG: hypothetical protein GWN46_04020 [Gammaproteobacteria bacterium]|nr:caspase family protein [Gammaproteobacteria bacterium]NIS04016.1 caspase family protein [Gammaproteobacteria bacterium]NIV46022.1 hypothetical protein [Gammaproteobacteria bacterium]
MPRIAALAAILFTSLLTTGAAGQGLDAPRIALVIGNGAYQDAPLRNPVNDARAMSQRLDKLGFHVISLENGGRDAMQKAILEFATSLKEETTGLFYYAGHGMQSRGRNYLLPVDADIDSERALRFEALDVQTILEEMQFAGNRMNIVILDACRNNPFERRFRGGSRGLAAIDAARGVLIAYATAPGAVAADGDGNNGLYTSELLSALEEPNLKVEEVFKRVRVAVTGRTNGAQVPWESSSLTGDFVFNQRGAAAPAAAAATTAPSGDTNHEALFWETIKDSDNSADFRAYLKQFPQGTFAGLALIRLSDLEKATRRDEPSTPRRLDSTLNVALLPFNGWHGGGHLATLLNKMEQGIRFVLSNEPRIRLKYAYDHDGDNDPRLGDAARFWEGPALAMTPRSDEVLAAGRELGVDMVLTYFAKRTKNEIYMVAYLFDIRSGKSMTLELRDEPGKGGYAKDLTHQLLTEFFQTG